MFINIVQPNMNGANGTPFAPDIQVINGQNGFDTNSFIKILTAIVSGFNNTVMNLEGGLFANNSPQTITVDNVSKGLFVDNNSNVVTVDALSDILQQMISQLQMIGIPQPVIAIDQNNQKSADILNNLTAQIHVNVNGNTALVNFVMKSEDRMQKVKVYTDDNSNGNSLLQIKAMADTVNGQEFQNIIPGDGDTQLLQMTGLQGNQPASNKISQPGVLENASTIIRNNNVGNDQHMHIKTTMQKPLIVEGQAAGIEHKAWSVEHHAASDTRLSAHDSPRLPHDTIVSVSHLYNTQYVENDPSIVVKEPIHVSRLNELAEVIEKTVKAGDKHLIIKLEPPDLGSIQIKLRMDNGMLRADLKVDSPVVKDLFSMAIPQIKTSLEDSGIRVSDFFVDVKEDYYSDRGRQQGDTNQQNKQNKKQEKFFDYFA